MVRIFVIKDTGAFTDNAIFGKYSGRISAFMCVVLPSMDGLDDLLSSGALEAISFPPYSENERTAFIRDYTEFIASLNCAHKEKFLWWCTDISSKNRYVSPLPDLIQELMEFDRGLRACQDRPLLFVGPSIGIYRALDKMVIKHGRKLIWPDAARQIIFKSLGGAIKSLARLSLYAARFYARAVWARAALGPHAGRWLSPQKQFYVIKTFSYPSSWNEQGEYNDSFFGRLPRILSKDKNVLVWSYHWTGYREFIKRIPADGEIFILPVEFFLGLDDVLRAVWRILTFRVPVKGKEFFRRLDVSDILRFELARTINGVQIFQLLHYDATHNMFKKLSAQTFLFTFENNPWERMCMLACRHFSPSTKVIGCQHSVVPEAALNMFVNPLESTIVPLPDRVLTTGGIPKEILQYYGDYGSVPVIKACALRYDYLFRVKPGPRQKGRGQVLLVLDGVEQTRQMLTFVLEQLGRHENYKLRVRCHPALPWSLLKNKFHFEVASYANIDIATGPLQDDLAWSDMVIYWQSAIVLEAISMGKPVINYKSDDILSYDPLFQSDALKWEVTEHGRLCDAIAAIEQMDEASYQKQLAQALQYMRRYFYPESAAALELFKFD
jgi:hypothetical protein